MTGKSGGARDMMRGGVGHLGDWRRQGTGGRETRDRWGMRGDKRQVGAGDNRQEGGTGGRWRGGQETGY